MKKDLINIIEETPLALRPTIKIQKPLGGGFYDVYLVRGMTMNMSWNVKGIALSYECDNMAETLVHESLHVMYPKMDEKNIKKWTGIYYNTFPNIKKAAHKRIVDKLTEYELNGKMKKYKKYESHD